MRIRKSWAVAAAAAMAVASFAVFQNTSQAQGASEGLAFRVGDTIPSINSTDLQGKRVRLTDYKGKVLLIDFWATWCPPCRAEVPGVVKTYKKYNKQGFEILGVSLDRDKAALTKYIRENDMAWRQVYDTEAKGALSSKFKVQFIPTVYLVDGTTGKVLSVNPRGESLEPALVAALKKRAR